MEPGGQFDIQQLLAAAAQMQGQLMNAQQQLADAEVEGTAGGGLVKATVNGQGELVDLVISAEAIDPADPAETAQTVADLVLAACRDAYEAAADLQDDLMGPLAAGLGGDTVGTMGFPPIPGMPGFPALGESGAGAEEPGATDPGER